MEEIRLPRLMDREMREVARLRPVRLSMEMNMTPLSTAEMELAEGEAPVTVGMLAELYDAAGSAGIFRVSEVERACGGDGGQVVRLEHGLCTLGDDVLPGYTEVGGATADTRAVLQALLARQTGGYWVLGECGYSDQYAYSFENENLLTAIISIAEPLEGLPVWEFDQSGLPWKLHLRRASDADACECRMSRNLAGVKVSVDRTELCTRIYPLGYGEGADQLHIGSVNGGVKHLDADTIGVWGVASSVYVEPSITDAATLKAAAQSVLARAKEPRVTVELDAEELYALTGERMDRFHLGRLCRLPLADAGVMMDERVVSIRRTDVFGQPTKVRVTLANRAATAVEALTALSRKASIGELYSQGAASEYSVHFGDNCDEAHPAKLRFYIDEDAVHVNKVAVRFTLEAFRGYTKSASAGGTGAIAAGSISVRATVPAQTISTGYQVGAVAEGYHYHNATTMAATIPVTISTEGLGQALNVGLHTHPISFGIYETKTATAVTVTVDGAAVPASAIVGGTLDAVSYLAKDGEGRIRRGAWHEIAFTPNGLGRVTADVHVRTFIRSVTGDNW